MDEEQEKSPSWTPAVVVGLLIVGLVCAACAMSGVLENLLNIRIVVIGN